MTAPTGDRFKVMLLVNGGVSSTQGNFRSREEARRWAGRREAWVVFEPVMPGEKVRWTVKPKAATRRRS